MNDNFPNLFSEKRDILESFGFSKLQAKIYVTNCVLGPASAKEIMNKCEMHKVEVYRVLYELEKMGTIERILSHPTKFKCRPPKEAITNLIAPKINLLSKINSEKEEIIDWLEKISNGTNSSIGEGFELYQGKHALKKMIEMVNKASNEIKHIFNTAAYDEINELGLLNTFNNIPGNGLKVKEIINIEKTKQNNKLFVCSNVERRHSDKVYSWMLIVDDSKIIFSSAPKALPNEKFLYTENVQFINHYIKNFDSLWNESTVIKSKINKSEEQKQSKLLKQSDESPIITVKNNVESDFEVYKEDIAEKKMIEIANRTTKEIYYIGRWNNNLFRPEFTMAFNEAINRGVKVKGILELPKTQLHLLKKFSSHKQVERRYSPIVYTTILIFDRSEIIFSSSPEPLPGEEFIYTRNKDFIKYKINVFNTYWNESIPFEDKIREMDNWNINNKIKPQLS